MSKYIENKNTGITEDNRLRRRIPNSLRATGRNLTPRNIRDPEHHRDPVLTVMMVVCIVFWVLLIFFHQI